MSPAVLPPTHGFSLLGGRFALHKRAQGKVANKTETYHDDFGNGLCTRHIATSFWDVYANHWRVHSRHCTQKGGIVKSMGQRMNSG
jgi:hypothetical protein